MKELHVFDMDDTLLTTPTFADMMDDEKVRTFLDHIRRGFLVFMSKHVDFKRVGDFIVLIDERESAPLSPSYLNLFEEKLISSEREVPNPEVFSKQVGIKRSSLKDILKALTIVSGHVIIGQVPGFHADHQTIGKSTNPELTDAYSSVLNKMILTGRSEKLKRAIAVRLIELGLHFPNYGLYCYSGDKGKSIKDFKAQVILDSIAKYGWDKVHFYEDKYEWLTWVERIVTERCPNIIFVGHHVKNIHDSKRL